MLSENVYLQQPYMYRHIPKVPLLRISTSKQNYSSQYHNQQNAPPRVERQSRESPLNPIDRSNSSVTRIAIKARKSHARGGVTKKKVEVAGLARVCYSVGTVFAVKIPNKLQDKRGIVGLCRRTGLMVGGGGPW